MRTFTSDELREVLRKHLAWARSEAAGERAYLEGAYLRGAYLQGANLQGADLEGAMMFPNREINSYRDLLWVGPLGSRNDWLLVNLPTLRISAGCFEGPIDAFVAKVESTHADNEYGREYKATAAYLRALVEARKAPEAASERVNEGLVGR